MAETLVINEIYLSVQGESTFAGLPCIFIRLTACNLRCSYCDTAYAFTEGKKLELESILARVEELARPYTVAGPHPDPLPEGEGRSWSVRQAGEGSAKNVLGKLPLVELTGGEPLLQRNSVPLMRALCEVGYTVLVETSGALDISPLDPRVRRIMDLKCPSSGECERNRWENIPHLRSTDEIKFVIGTAEDYEWARKTLREQNLAAICPVLFSWVSPLQARQQDASLKKVPAGQTPITRRELVERLIADALPARFQLQMHKFIWPPDERGV